uniref:Uncharacterized protein n=1 Tax=Kitasatospora kifunensis TaxID=58351 RepID=E5F139_KITKI|nr:hypothetical protein [Kitasatospora kifunensis]
MQPWRRVSRQKSDTICAGPVQPAAAVRSAAPFKLSLLWPRHTAAERRSPSCISPSSLRSPACWCSSTSWSCCADSSSGRSTRRSGSRSASSSRRSGSSRRSWTPPPAGSASPPASAWSCSRASSWC